MSDAGEGLVDANSRIEERMEEIQEARRLHGRVSPIVYIGVHDIDQILWLHPGPVRAVYAKALKGRVWQELGVIDYGWLNIEFEDGALGVVEVGWGYPEEWAGWNGPTGWGGFGDVRMNVIGADGVLNINFTPMGLYACDHEGWKLPDTRHWPVINGKQAGAVKLEMEHFFECVRLGKTPLVTAEDGRRSLEIALAAEQSIKEDRRIPLPLAYPAGS